MGSTFGEFKFYITLTFFDFTGIIFCLNQELLPCFMYRNSKVKNGKNICLGMHAGN